MALRAKEHLIILNGCWRQLLRIASKLDSTNNRNFRILYDALMEYIHQHLMRTHIWKGFTTFMFKLFVIKMVNSLELMSLASLKILFAHFFKAGIPFYFFRRFWIFSKEILNFLHMIIILNFVDHVHGFFRCNSFLLAHR